MTGRPSMASAIGGVALLERAVQFTLGSLHLVTPDAMARPTPCTKWDLRALLVHMIDSLAALEEALDLGYVVPDLAVDVNTDPVAALRARACKLLGACANTTGEAPVSVAGCPLSTSLVTRAGAVEVTVHGWDVARACGSRRPIPPALARELLPLLPMLVVARDRPGRFAAPAGVSPLADAGEQVLAFLGRRP